MPQIKHDVKAHVVPNHINIIGVDVAVQVALPAVGVRFSVLLEMSDECAQLRMPINNNTAVYRVVLISGSTIDDYAFIDCNNELVVPLARKTPRVDIYTTMPVATSESFRLWLPFGTVYRPVPVCICMSLPSLPTPLQCMLTHQRRPNITERICGPVHHTVLQSQSNAMLSVISPANELILRGNVHVRMHDKYTDLLAFGTSHRRGDRHWTVHHISDAKVHVTIGMIPADHHRNVLDGRPTKLFDFLPACAVYVLARNRYSTDIIPCVPVLHSWSCDAKLLLQVQAIWPGMHVYTIDT